MVVNQANVATSSTVKFIGANPTPTASLIQGLLVRPGESGGRYVFKLFFSLPDSTAA
jgi:hypothetical protein